jgi:hypothetical protein
MFPGAVSWGSILTLRRGHRHWAAAQGPAESRAAVAEQPALVARLVPMAARCVAPPGPTAGSQPAGAGSLVPMAHSLATEVWSAGRSFGFCALQSATSCPSICGRGLLDRRGRANLRIIGVIQSTNRPSPVLAPPCTNPACSHAAVISAQARWRGEVRCSAHY